MLLFFSAQESKRTVYLAMECHCHSSTYIYSVANYHICMITCEDGGDGRGGLHKRNPAESPQRAAGRKQTAAVAEAAVPVQVLQPPGQLIVRMSNEYIRIYASAPAWGMPSACSSHPKSCTIDRVWFKCR